MAVKRWELAQATRRRAFEDGPAARVVIGADAGSRAGLVEVTVPPGGAMPEHDHSGSEALVIVLGGRARLTAAGDGGVTELDPGGVVTIPVGERVRVENQAGDEARLLVVLTPPDFTTVLAGGPEPE